MARQRRSFSKEFKLSAVRLVNQQGYSPGEAARSLGIDAGNVRNWVERYGQDESAAAPPSGDGALQAEVRRLRAENAQLVMEREILKKAAAFFAREQR